MVNTTTDNNGCTTSTNNFSVDCPMSIFEFDKIWMSKEKQEAKSSTKSSGKINKAAVKKQQKKAWKRGARPQDMPRRPLSAYNLFFKDQREAIVQERTIAERARSGNPKIKKAKIAFEELAKTIGSLWKSIDPKLLQQYKAIAEQDSKRYKAEMNAYLTKADAERSQEPKEKQTSVGPATTTQTNSNVAFPFEPRQPQSSHAGAFVSMPEPSFLQRTAPDEHHRHGDCASVSSLTNGMDEQDEWAPLRPDFLQHTLSSDWAVSDPYIASDCKESQEEEHHMLHHYDPEPLPAFSPSSFPSTSLFEDNSLARLLARADKDTMDDYQQSGLSEDMLSGSPYIASDCKESQDQRLQQYDPQPLSAFYPSSSSSLFNSSLVRLLAGTDDGTMDYQQSCVISGDMISGSSSWMEPTPFREQLW